MAYTNTSGTTLKYASSCANQVETLTVAAGTVTTAGNVTITLTGKDFNGSLAAFNVAVALSDNQDAVATKIRAGLNAKPEVTNFYTVGGTGSAVVLTRIVPAENDTTLNIALGTGTQVGIAAVTTSSNTTAGGTFSKLVDIVSYPDLGTAPSKLDTTDLSATTTKTSILGLQDAPDLTFECNYDETVLSTLNGLTASNYYFQLNFGSTDGMFNWQGQVRAYANGGGVDEVRKMTVVCSAATPIYFSMS